MAYAPDANIIEDDNTGGQKQGTTGAASTNASSTSTTNANGQEMSDYLQNTIFTATNFMYFIWFLGVYLIVYFLLSPDKSMMGRIINIVILVWVLYLCSYIYFSMTADEKTHFWRTMVDWTKEYFDDYMNFWWAVGTLVVFYIVVFVLNVPMKTGEKPLMAEILESKLWIVIFMFIVIFFFKYFLGINLNNLFFDYFDKGIAAIFGGEKVEEAPKVNPPLNTVDVSANKPAAKEEVFNIMNNLYTYEDARAICKSYGARLATYDDIENSYNNGAEWCSYGWSENQMAYFPTQKKTWEELQKNPKTKNNCGRPGVNGGYMANPNLKFGVNCYGVKPKAKQVDLDLMSAQKNAVLPQTEEESEMDKKVKFWKENQDKLLMIHSYNNNQWSRY